MRKSVEKLGMEALHWEMVQMELRVDACQKFKEAVLRTVQQLPQACHELNVDIMTMILRLEADQRERLASLELEQAQRERAMGLLPPSIPPSV